MHCVNSGAVMTVPAISMPIMNTQTYLALLTFNYSNLAIVSPYAFCAFSLLGAMQLRMSALFYANALIDTENAFLKLLLKTHVDNVRKRTDKVYENAQS